LRDDRVDGGSSGENEEGGHEFGSVSSFTEGHARYKTVKSFFYVHGISECDKQNILNLEVVLFCLKHRASTKELPITDFLGKK
jgi:hypothetical protein